MQNKLIVDELMRMMTEDQAMRDAAVLNHDAWDVAVDERNTARLKEIVAEIGWPTVSKVGSEASHAAWLLVQHADKTVAFQQEALRLMGELPDGEVRKQEIAYLTDRVLVNEGKAQHFGTQFMRGDDGAMCPRPIEDEPALEDRRKVFELDTFEENMQRVQKYSKR